MMHEPSWHEHWTGEDARSGAAGHHPRRLIARIASGVFLGVVSLGATFAGSYAFAALVAVMAIMMAWEWGGIVRSRRYDFGFVLHAAAIAVCLVLSAIGKPQLALVALGVAAIVMAAAYGRQNGLMSAAGIFYIGIPAISLVWFRNDVPYGFTAILLIFSVVWAADTAAYVGGKTVGGVKFWPSISPNKTWAGTCSALVASALVGAIFSFLLTGVPSLYLIVCTTVLGFVALAGDLAESAFKRVYRLKDASNLIPGHGGFMDRLDGIAAAATFAALICLLVDASQPAKALLFGN